MTWDANGAQDKSDDWAVWKAKRIRAAQDIEGYRCRLCATEATLASDGKTPICKICGIWVGREGECAE